MGPIPWIVSAAFTQPELAIVPHGALHKGVNQPEKRL